jgi:transcriptional regulator with XRE-family HTH domain
MRRDITQARRRARRINRALVELRLNAGLTPNDLARRAGLSGNTVRAAERGLYVDPRSQFAIAQALGAKPLDLFPFERQREAA